MGSFKGHALPGSFFLVAGLWWTGKHSLWHVTRRNKNLGSGRVASRASQRRLELIESSIVVFFSFVGKLNLNTFDIDMDSFPLMAQCKSAACAVHSRDFGRAVCWRAKTPVVQRRREALGRCNELATLHHVPLLWPGGDRLSDRSHHRCCSPGPG